MADDEPDLPERDRELSGLKSIREACLELFRNVRKGFEDETGRADRLLDNWEIYNCQLGQKQVYNGNAQIFIPIVQNAVDARKTRFVGQLFPESGRNVDVLSSDGKYPMGIMALLEDYIRKARLRTSVFPALCVGGDVEGQYTVYVEWTTQTRHTVYKTKRPVEVDIAGQTMEAESEEPVETIETEEIEEGWPEVSIVSDQDLLILPVTAGGISEAIEAGGSVTIRRKWTKEQLRQMIAAGDIVKSKGEELIDAMSKVDRPGRKDNARKLAEAAGIKSGSGGGKYAEGYETWTKLKVDGERRLCRAYLGGPDMILGAKLNPYWCDRVPILSAPVKKVLNMAKGRAPVTDVADLQIYANDMINEAADTAHFSAMPIILSDPEKNPGPMILGLGAIWRADPNSTKSLEFPPLYRYNLEVIQGIQTMIFQTLGVNPAMLPQQTGKPGTKRNQAEVALELQVDILTTADAVTTLEQEIASPLLQWFVDLDHQFRDREVTVQAYGEMGERANIEVVPPIEMDHRYVYRWNGVEAARNAARIQQQIGAINMLKAIPPQAMQGYRLNLAPAINNLVLGAFGSRTAPLVLEDLSKSMSMAPQQENELLDGGFAVMVHPTDDDPEHLASHLAAMQSLGDAHGTFRQHIEMHLMQMEAKVTAQQQKMMGGQGGAGGPQGPQPGAAPQAARPVRGPPGTIPPDSLASAGAPQMPRKMA